MDQIIAGLKKLAHKVVIVEDVKKRPFPWIGKLMNYCCARDYYRPCSIFTRQEFETLLLKYGFTVNHHDDRYSSAVYESKEQS